MKGEYYKQVACVSEKTATLFEAKVNSILTGISNPEIVLDQTKPFTAYIFYRVRKDVPESLLELLELIDGTPATCEECPYFQRSTDKRKKWHTCKKKAHRVRAEARACEIYYTERMAPKEELGTTLLEAYKDIPYKPE